MERKRRILAVCTHNDCRSQFAEAFFRQFAGDLFEVHSAGLEPTGIHPLAVAALAEVGLACRDCRAKSVKEFLGRSEVSWLVTVCEEAEQRCPMIFINLRNRLYWPCEDPVGFSGSEQEVMQKFRNVRDEVAERVKHWVAEYRTANR